MDADSSVQQVYDLIARHKQAICDLDVDAILANYADDNTLFDVKLPYRLTGVEALKRMWQRDISCFPSRFDIEQRDMTVRVSGELAVSHWLFRVVTAEKDSPMENNWMRITACCERRGGRWYIVHEHISFPLNPQTGGLAFGIEPEKAHEIPLPGL